MNLLSALRPRVIAGGLSDSAVREMAEARLKRFLALEAHWPRMNDEGRRLVRRAQFSAFSQMQQLGQGRRAKALVLSAELARELSR